jgi:hypothetical protein
MQNDGDNDSFVRVKEAKLDVDARFPITFAITSDTKLNPSHSDGCMLINNEADLIAMGLIAHVDSKRLHFGKWSYIPRIFWILQWKIKANCRIPAPTER